MFTGKSVPGQARLKYLDGDYEVVQPGQFVVCAATNRKIPMEDLRYWSVDDQEAYYDAEAAIQAWRRKHGFKDDAKSG